MAAAMEFWRFRQGSAGIETLDGTYDPALVLLSVLVAALSAYTALAVVERTLATRSPAVRRGWLSLGAVVMALGIWSMHFTGMLAYALPVPTTYSLDWALLSVLPAIAGSAMALHTISRDSIGRTRLLLAAVSLALGIGGMHYAGMEGVHADARLHYDPPLFLLSIAVAVLLSVAALYARFLLARVSDLWSRQLLGALMIGCAVSGMHYTAMAATRFEHAPLHVVAGGPANDTIALAIAVMVMFFTGLALLGTIIDGRITSERLRARQSEDRHRATLSSMQDGLITVGAHCTIEAANPSAATMLGYEVEQLVGKPLTALLDFGAESIAECDPASISKLILRAPDAHANRADGRRINVQLNVHQLVVGRRQVIDILVRDTTIQHRVEMERRRLAAAVDQAADAILITNSAGIIEYVNPAFERMTGYSRTEAVGRSPRMIGSGVHDGSFFADLWRELLSGNVWTGAIRNRRKDGTEFEMLQTISPIRDDRGEITHFVAAGRDVTQQKQVELQVRHSQKLEAIGQLAAGIAHEINTPIQYVSDNVRFLQSSFADLLGAFGALQRLRSAMEGDATSNQLTRAADAAVKATDAEFLAEEIPRAIEQTIEGVTRVATIVRAMKEFSHPGAGKQLVDLNRSIANTITVATHEWKYVADVESDFDPSIPPIPCASGEINQVVLNLIVNAAHAIEGSVADGGKGRIRISTRVNDGWAEIRVADNGGGIPEEIRERIFEPFFTTKEAGRGTGQGLNLAHTIVTRKHGGSIDFESEAGAGTTFIVRLPMQDLTEVAA